jgi:hypothetical protein
MTQQMKTNRSTNKIPGSTYALLARSKDKKRDLVETVLHGLVALSALAAILQFTNQPVSFGA